MNQIFANIASGVITTDAQDTVIGLNQAAEHILTVKEEEARGRSYVEALPGLGQVLVPLVNTVRQQREQATEHELELDLPHRGQVFLRLHISPLRNNGHAAGVAIVLDDLTKQRQLERKVQHVRAAFERHVAPCVVEQVLSDPTSARLGGVRKNVTVLFADVRGFVSFGEKVEPEFQIEMLNRHLTRAAAAVMAEEGTLDKFMGDCMMAIFNAPQPQPDHTLRAVRTALAIQRAIAEMHAQIPPNERLHFGIGIAAGHAVVGNIGSTKLYNYTAIGDIVNLAYLLQSHARPGQILLSGPSYERVEEHIVGQELGLVHLKGHSKPDLVIEVLGLQTN
ncbi:MAG: PAS domain-containing protein [Chloroflexi bacterium]|nr:PAS domain-containing protein [Chloroflexota bacterium]